MKTKVMLLAVVLMISSLVALPVGAVQTSDLGCGGSQTGCGEQKNKEDCQKECDGEKKKECDGEKKQECTKDKEAKQCPK